MRMILVIAMCTLMLTGCAQTVDLTEEEQNVLGEHMAELALKDVVSSEKKEEPQIEDKEQEEKKDKDQKEEVKELKNNWNIGEGVEVEVINIKSSQNYPESLKGYFNIEPHENEKLMIVTLSVYNHSKQEVNFDMLTSNVQFHLESNTTSYKPMNTFLPNDIQYMSINLTSEQKEEALLLYSVPKDINMEELDLTIIDEQDVVTIALDK